MHRYKSLIRSLNIQNISNQRLYRLVLSVFLMVIVFAVIDISLFIGGTRAAFSDQVSSTIARFITGSWEYPNCTHSMGYWKNHPDDWPADGITIGGITYSMEEAMLIFHNPSQGDASYVLAYQLMAAKLNVLNGAEKTIVEETILDADEWLIGNPLGSDPSNPEREIGISLAENLELFNTGEIGPGICVENESRNISSKVIWATDGEIPAGNELLDIFSSVTPTGMLPELPGTPITSPPTEQPENSRSVPVLEPTNTSLPTQTITPTQIGFYTPTLAPTMEPSEEPSMENLLPTPTLAPSMDTALTPTYAPAEALTPTSTFTPTQVFIPTPTPAPTLYTGPPGCTQPVDYWLAHPDQWELEQFVLGELEVDRDQAREILSADPKGEVGFILAQQYLTTLLNIESPADPSSIQEVLVQVEYWFEVNSLGNQPAKVEGLNALQLAENLESYNLGEIGPGSCSQELPSPEPTNTKTPTNTNQPVPTLGPTLMPTLSIPTPTSTPTLEPPAGSIP